MSNFVNFKRSLTQNIYNQFFTFILFFCLFYNCSENNAYNAYVEVGNATDSLVVIGYEEHMELRTDKQHTETLAPHSDATIYVKFENDWADISAEINKKKIWYSVYIENPILVIPMKDF